MKLPLYQGETLQPARTPKGAAPAENPFSSSFMQAAAIAANKLRSIEEAIQDRQEFTLEQNRSAQATEATNQLNNKLANDLSLPDGHPDSPYDEHGILRPEYADNLKAQYGSIADSWGSGFTSEQGMQNAYKAAQQWRQGVNETVDSKIRAASKGRADRAISNNIKTCLAYRDYNGATTANLNAYKRGYKTEAEYLYDQNAIDLDRAGFQIDSCRSADEVSSWLNNPANSKILTRNPKLYDKAQGRIDSYLRAKATARKAEVNARIDEHLAILEEEGYFIEDAIDEYEANPDVTTTEKSVGSISRMDETKGFEDTYDAAPEAASGNIRILYLKTGGDFSTPENRKLAYAALQTEASLINPYDDNDIFYMQELAKELGFSASDANTAIKRFHGENKTAGFNAAKAAEDIKKYTRARKEQFSTYAQQHMVHDVEGMGETVAKLDYQQKAIDSALQETLFDFNSWYEENKELDADQHATKFAAIYEGKLRAQRYYDAQYYKTDIMPVIKSAIVAAEQMRSEKDSKEKDKLVNRAEYEKLLKEYTNAIDEYVKKNGVDDILATHPLQAAEIRFVRDAALERQENIAFQKETDNSLSSKLKGTKDHYILYLPKTDKPETDFKYLVSYAGDGQYVPVRVVYVKDLPTAVASEKLQKRAQVYGKNFNRITFKNNMLSFSQVETKEVDIKKARPELIKAQERNKRSKQRVKSIKGRAANSSSNNQEEEPDSVPLIQAESSLFPDAGLVSESHFMPTGDLPL